VLHSTRAMRPSKSWLSTNIRSNRTPSRAIQPKDTCKWSKLCRKKSVITKANTHPDFASNHLSLIGYWKKIRNTAINDWSTMKFVKNKRLFSLPFLVIPRAWSCTSLTPRFLWLASSLVATTNVSLSSVMFLSPNSHPCCKWTDSPPLVAK